MLDKIGLSLWRHELAKHKELRFEGYEKCLAELDARGAKSGEEAALSLYRFAVDDARALVEKLMSVLKDSWRRNIQGDSEKHAKHVKKELKKFLEDEAGRINGEIKEYLLLKRLDASTLPHAKTLLDKALRDMLSDRFSEIDDLKIRRDVEIAERRIQTREKRIESLKNFLLTVTATVSATILATFLIYRLMGRRTAEPLGAPQAQPSPPATLLPPRQGVPPTREQIDRDIHRLEEDFQMKSADIHREYQQKIVDYQIYAEKANKNKGDKYVRGLRRLEDEESGAVDALRADINRRLEELKKARQSL